MSADEKLKLLKAMFDGDVSDEMLNAYLTIAGQEVIERAYPYDQDVTEVPDRYAVLQVEIALYKLNKRGGEGEISHSENGINRSYETADTPKSMLDRIVPMCGTFGSTNESTTTE